ncbi:MAG: tetratricopeptide repeat protein [Kiritimatiellae bacterium]|nr:tetratricopeptide repeat protein [Kiritimatiellia bacterium]
MSLDKLKSSAQWVLLAVALALLSFSIFQWFQSRKEGLRQEVYLDYTTAYTPDALRQVIEAYPNQPEAALARLQLGNMLAQDGEHEEALQVFEGFIAKSPRHPLAGRAVLGRLMALEELGRLDEALEGYKGVAADSLVYPQALFGRARTLEKLGRHAEAVPVYKTIEELVPDSVWAYQAERYRDAASLEARLQSTQGE